jgi:hypothetical protein
MPPLARRALWPQALSGVAIALICSSAGPCAAQTQATIDGPEAPKPKVQRTTHFTTWSDQGGTSRSDAPGVGLFATSGHTAVDLTAPTEMLDGPNGSLFNTAAGIGWHSGHMSAMFGYMKPSSVKSATQFRSDTYTPAYKNSARVGVGWSLHF